MFEKLIKLATSPLRTFTKNPPYLPIPKASIDWDRVRKESEDRSRNSMVPSHTVCKAIELKAGDVIVHNYSSFEISECGCGFGAANEFGNYFWIEGKFKNGNPTDPEPVKRFWSFQECPVIKLSRSKKED